MVKITKRSLEKQNVINELYKTAKAKNKKIFRRIALLLESRARTNISVNLCKLQKLENVKDNNLIIIPGKVLSKGELSKNITIYAYNYSDLALKKLGKNAKTLLDFCKDDIDFKKTVIIR